MSYLTEIKREQTKATFGANYEAFLRSCEMNLRLFAPRDGKDLARCLELIQRSNQLNLSNTRYTTEQLQDLLSRERTLCVAMDCYDRFGKYGIVGFFSVDESRTWLTIRDLVISCRVAQKRVEHALIHWLGRRALRLGKTSLRAQLTKTERNGPIRQVFDDLLFRPVEQQNGHTIVELSLNELGSQDIVAVRSEL